MEALLKATAGKDRMIEFARCLIFWGCVGLVTYWVADANVGVHKAEVVCVKEQK